jgi:hypothetical protein
VARLFVYECSCGEFTKVERVEYTPPSNASQINAGRWKIDITALTEHNGYPAKTEICTKCNKHVISQEYEIGNIPPVYFNYLGED